MTEPTAKVFGKSASELQSDFVIDKDKGEISGTLKHITGWQDFSTAEAEQEGYYFTVQLTVPAGADKDQGWVKWNKNPQQVPLTDDNGAPNFVARLAKPGSTTASGTFVVTANYGAGAVVQNYSYNFNLLK